MWCAQATHGVLMLRSQFAVFNAKNVGVSEIPLLYTVQSDYAPLCVQPTLTERYKNYNVPTVLIISSS